jgi:hypothetical protein
MVSGAEQSHSESVVGAPLAHRTPINPPRIGAQDTMIPALSFQYTVHNAHRRIRIRIRILFD